MSQLIDQLAKVAAVRERLEGLKVTDPDLIQDTIEGQTDLLEIMNWLLGRLGDEEYLADAIRARIADLETRVSDSLGRASRLRATLLHCLEATGLKTVRLPEATLSLRTLQPSLISVDEAALPEEFWKVERKVSRSAINAALKEGREVPGAVMSNGGVSLAVRRK